MAWNWNEGTQFKDSNNDFNLEIPFCSYNCAFLLKALDYKGRSITVE